MPLKAKLHCFKAKFHKGSRLQEHTYIIIITTVMINSRSSSSSSSSSSSNSSSSSSSSLRKETSFSDCQVPKGTLAFFSEEEEVTVGISVHFLPGLH